MTRQSGSRYALLLLLLLLSAASVAHALYFVVKENEVRLVVCASSCIARSPVNLTAGAVDMKVNRCFIVDVPAQTPVRVEYESPDTTDVMVREKVEGSIWTGIERD